MSLDLFLYYRWYHIIWEGKQTRWSAVSRIIPTALFVDGKGIFSSLLAQYQLVIIENTIWSGGLKFYIWFPSVFSGKFHPILVTYWHLKCLFNVKIPVHALHTLLTSVLQIYMLNTGFSPVCSAFRSDLKIQGVSLLWPYHPRYFRPFVIIQSHGFPPWFCVLI